ncbi:hypothetical protein LCGC14_2051420 [marine sediment metagenome]|uniref:ATP-dependent DNA ligase family profile domain-containing protein n=1 Tax=marine sediment metagenome TaxID=412755 RepID=A0A0F9HKY8_9ZZZZ
MSRTGIMLAYPFEEKRLSRWKPPYILQPKLDGERCRSLNTLLFPNSQEQPSRSMLVSSEENPFFSVPHINQAIIDQGLFHLELDGELYAHHLTFEEIHSRVSRTVNLHPDYEAIGYYIFDIVNIYKTQIERMNILLDLSIAGPLTRVPICICNNLDEVMRSYDDFIEAGYEGMIVRHATAPYLRRRSTFMMKYKSKKEDVYEIKGFSEELSIEGDLKDTLGRIICASGDADVPWLGLYPAHVKPPEGYFGVGSGFSDKKRKSIWGYPYFLEGRSIKVQYQHLTSGKKVPRFPVFVEIIEGGEDD